MLRINFLVAANIAKVRGDTWNGRGESKSELIVERGIESSAGGDWES